MPTPESATKAKGPRAAVGRSAPNLRDDVVLVQTMLTERGYSPGRIDGVCGRRTVAAIIEFQRTFLRYPDGVVNVGGFTWHRLNSDAPPRASGSKPRSGGSQPPAQQPPEAPIGDGPELLTKLLPKPDRSTINVGLTAVSNAYMLEALGNPREDYTQEDQPITNEKLKKRVVVESVGRFKAYGLAPAVASLRKVMADIEKEQPGVYPHITSGGMLVCRLQRDSKTKISNHSWGCAIDLKIRGQLDRRRDDKVQHGLTLIAPIFNRHGWYWGASFPVEDAMHFEASKALVEAWKAQIK